MSEVTYYATSEDTEYWTCTELNDAVVERIDRDDSVKDEDIINVYSAKSETPAPSSFFPSYIFEQMTEHVYDNYHEQSADIFEGLLSRDQQKELNTFLEVSVDKFFSDNDIKINFGNLQDIKPIKIKIISANDFEWIELSEEV